MFCVVAMLPLALALRRPRRRHRRCGSAMAPHGKRDTLGISPNTLMVLLMRRRRRLLRRDVDAAGAYRRLLRRSRLRAGARRRDAVDDARLRPDQPDRLAASSPTGSAALATLLIGSVLQGVALFFYLLFDGLVSLYVISALFGLFQGGIVPMYAIIVREYFAPRGGRHAARHRADGDAGRHGARRLDVGRDLRPDRLLPRRLRQRPRLELINILIVAWLLLRPGRRAVAA